MIFRYFIESGKFNLSNNDENIRFFFELLA